jgi:hypothetical protein
MGDSFSGKVEKWKVEYWISNPGRIAKPYTDSFSGKVENWKLEIGILD